MTNLMQDLKYGVRMLLKNPVFTVAAVLTLGLGIGLNAATFSAVYGILLRPLGGTEDPGELVQLYREWPGIPWGSNSVPHFNDLRERTGDAFEEVTAWNFAQIGISADGTSERQMGMLVADNFFDTYGARPALGRFFLPEEGVGLGAHPVAVLGHGYWESRFGADPGIVGRTLEVNGQLFEVVGVADPAFRGPVSFASIPIYFPLTMQGVVAPGYDWWESRGSNMLSVTARLRDGVSLERARQVVDATLLQLRDEYPEAYEEQLGTWMVPQSEVGIHPSMRGAQVGMSSVVMGVVALLLLIACVNVANLFLVRARERRREMGIRLSIGAGRGRIVRQLMTESLLFSLLAGGFGVVLAWFATKALAGFRPPMDGPWAFAVELDGTVLLFTLGVTLVTGFVFGMAPALQAANPNTVSAVKGEASAPGRGSRMTNLLVVAQMAGSLVLLVSSGLFLRSLQAATEIDPGFDAPDGIALVSLDPALQGYSEEEMPAFFDRLLERVAALPEVSEAGLTSGLPLGLGGSDRGVEVPGYEFSEGEARSFNYAWVTEGYIEALGVDLLEGRTFSASDDATGPPVIVVNRRFAERFWPGESAVGRVVHTAGEDREVIGVVETGKVRSLNEPPREYMYLPHRENPQSAVTVVARVRSDASAALLTLRAAIREIDAELPLYDVRTMENHMGLALLPARLGGSVLGVFGLLGLLLAAIGIYGVMAYSVAQRNRELGVRVALGADRGSVVRLVLGEGGRLAGIGMVIGLGLAVAAGQLVQGTLYGVSGVDPWTFLGVPAVLAAVALLAVWIPARRAASVDPMRALKAD